MPSTFQCTLATPEEQVLDDPVTYASIPAWDGQIGIAPSRAPLLAKLGLGSLRLDYADGRSRLFLLGGGFVQMKDNKLSMLATEALPAEGITREDAEQSLEQARLRTSQTTDEVAEKQQQISRAKAMLRLAQSQSG